MLRRKRCGLALAGITAWPWAAMAADPAIACRALRQNSFGLGFSLFQF